MSGYTEQIALRLDPTIAQLLSILVPQNKRVYRIQVSFSVANGVYNLMTHGIASPVTLVSNTYMHVQACIYNVDTRMQYALLITSARYEIQSVYMMRVYLFPGTDVFRSFPPLFEGTNWVFPPLLFHYLIYLQDVSLGLLLSNYFTTCQSDWWKTSSEDGADT